MVGGVVQSELEGEPTYAEGKLARLRQLTQAPLLMALGDSYYDLALLCEAEIAVAVDPGETLRRRLDELHRLVVTLELGGAGG
jgi:phosphoserine phosphatase